MKTAAKLLCVALTSALAACSSYDPPEIETGHRTSFDGEVLRIEIQREDGGSERFSTLRDRWFGWSWEPFLPNHSGRRWALLKSDRDGTSIAYTLVSWDNDDDTDYLAAGYWLRFEGFRPDDEIPLAAGDIVLFIDGTEIDSADPPELPLSGTANYVGEAGGIYGYRYGSDWTGNRPAAGGGGVLRHDDRPGEFRRHDRRRLRRLCRRPPDRADAPLRRPRVESRQAARHADRLRNPFRPDGDRARRQFRRR